MGADYWTKDNDEIINKIQINGEYEDDANLTAIEIHDGFKQNGK